MTLVISITIVFGVWYITKKPKQTPQKILPTNSTIKLNNFDCYGIIVDSFDVNYSSKSYRLRYQINTGEIISQWFYAKELDTIPWTK